MNEEEFEIEYLDEDEDVVNNYVQSAPVPLSETAAVEYKNVEIKSEPLLVERAQRKIKEEEYDSDYDPQEDLVAMTAPKKKKKFTPKRSQRVLAKKPVNQSPRVILHSKKPLNQLSNTSIQRKYLKPLKQVPELKIPIKIEVEDLNIRKKLDIHIPDYEDPLCMPVKAVMESEDDMKKLKNWNRACFEQFKKCDKVMAPDSGKAVKSTRTVVLRNVQNRMTGKVELTVWCKSAVENEKGQNKSDIFQYVLPRYREKKVIDPYPMYKQTQKETRKRTFESILVKEDHKDSEVLVVYKPKEATSAVYKLIEKKHSDDNEKPKLLMKEVTCCKVCAPCYQASWRAARKVEHANISCRVCSRSHTSVYNLLSHLRTHHTNPEVRKQRAHIARALASVVKYHYKCRICQEVFLSIRKLRKHVLTHRGTSEFICEVGNHIAS